MFKPAAIKVASIVAMVLSVLGLALSILAVWLGRGESNLAFIMGAASWTILLWASYIGFRLSSYKLYEDEYKKVGIRIYLIIVAFVLFLFVGVILGLILSVVLLGALWALKSNYDDWEPIETAAEPEDSTAAR